MIHLGITVDSTFIIDILRSDEAASEKARELDSRRDTKFLTTPVLYEITAGLLFTRSRSEAAAFRRISSSFAVLPFDEASATKAAEVRAELLRLGVPKGHVDVMIAGIAIANNHTLVSRDKDFQAISSAVDLTIEAY